MGDNRKAEYAMAPTSDPENPPEKSEQDGGNDVVSDEKQWSGLGKEELLRVADTPAWNWTRNILLVLFWVAWVVMLIVAIVIVVKVPRCPNVEWWEENPVQQVYVKSFRDADGDGIGDLKGISSQLEYLKKELGVQTLYLSSIFKQKNDSTDFGAETVDYTDIDSSLGNMSEFDELIANIQEQSMKIILEFIPNQSSDEHEWFMKSKMSRDNAFADFYIWANGVNGGPPNGWVNKYGEPAWTYVDSRGQYYYHRLSSSQPDLNYYNTEVVDEMKDILTFWLKKDVDGFVFKGMDYLIESSIASVANRRRRQVEDGLTTNGPIMTEDPMLITEMSDNEPTIEPEPMDPKEEPTYPSSQYSGGEEQLAQQHNVTKEFAKVLRDHSHLGKYRVFITEHNTPENAAEFYEQGGVEGREADFTINTGFAESLTDQLNTYELNKQINSLFDAKKAAGVESRWNSWMLGNSDMSRIRSRAPTLYRALQMVLMTLPGTPFNYQGDELGLEDVAAPSPKDASRGPFPWGNSTNGNFSKDASVKPWLPVAADLKQRNLEAQKENPKSDFNYFKKLVEYRGEPSLVAGAFNMTHLDNNVYSYIRAYPEWPKYLVAINFASNRVEVNVHNEQFESTQGHKMLSSKMVVEDEAAAVELNRLVLEANEAVLIAL